MTARKPGLRQSIAATAVALLTLVTAPTVRAIATYDALAEYTLTLSGVTDLDGVTVSGGWSVDAAGRPYLVDATSSGTAEADYLIELAPDPSLVVGDSVTQSTRSYGAAGYGSAASYASTDLELSVENLSGEALVFSFDYRATVESVVGGAFGEFAEGRASIEVTDELEMFETLLDAFVNLPIPPLSTSDSETGRYSFTLYAGESNRIAATIDSVGSAYSESAPETNADSLPRAESVPEPASIALVLIGLAIMGMRASRRPIKSA